MASGFTSPSTSTFSINPSTSATTCTTSESSSSSPALTVSGASTIHSVWRKSILWTHFTKLDDSSTRCDICGIKVATSKNTSNMMTVLYTLSYANNYAGTIFRTTGSCMNHTVFLAKTILSYQKRKILSMRKSSKSYNCLRQSQLNYQLKNMSLLWKFSLLLGDCRSSWLRTPVLAGC